MRRSTDNTPQCRNKRARKQKLPEPIALQIHTPRSKRRVRRALLCDVCGTTRPDYQYLTLKRKARRAHLRRPSMYTPLRTVRARRERVFIQISSRQPVLYVPKQDSLRSFACSTACSTMCSYHVHVHVRESDRSRLPSLPSDLSEPKRVCVSHIAQRAWRDMYMYM